MRPATRCSPGKPPLLALKPVMDAIAMKVPGLALNAWFLDNSHLVGTLEEIKNVVDLILREGRPRGLILSTTATVGTPSVFGTFSSTCL